MKTLLLGNGINIQFGGMAYSSSFIVERIRYASLVGEYDALFNNTITRKEIVSLFEDLVKIANEIKSGKYDESDYDEVREAIDDFKNRYSSYEIKDIPDILLEDWLLVADVFVISQPDLLNLRDKLKQGIRYILLDSIYNGGNIQNIYKRITGKAKAFFEHFDNFFTLNYDNNIEKLTNKTVYHLHGDFSVPADIYNPNTVLGHLLQLNGNSFSIPDNKKHCFCNALLDYSGKSKYKAAQVYNQFDQNGFSEITIDQVRKKHTSLALSSDYHYEDFQNISGDLVILGLSPNNDEHIFNIITNNTQLKSVTFYYYSENEKLYIEKHFDSLLFKCKSAKKLWKKLECYIPHVYFNHIPINNHDNDDIIKSLILLSRGANNNYSEDNMDIQDINRIKKEINHLSESEIKRLCTLIKVFLNNNNPDNQSLNIEQFKEEIANINFIALQEGISIPALYVICIMRFEKYIKK